MTVLRTLFFSFTFLPWALSSTATQLTAVSAGEDRPHNEEDYMETKKSKRDIVPLADYDPSVVFLPADSPDDAGPAAKDHADLPTCLQCVCITGSVYCEEVTPEMTAVPPLPKETTYLYARYNQIKKITTKDFADILGLKRIDLTGNIISEIEDGAFSKLNQLEELSLAENRLVKLPMLPNKLTSFNANNNRLKTKGVKANAFKKMNKLIFLYLAGNELEAVPQLPESLRIVHLQNNNITSVTDETFCKGNNTYYIRNNMNEIRLDGNPVVLAQYPNSFTCLKSLPIGRYY